MKLINHTNVEFLIIFVLKNAKSLTKHVGAIDDIEKSYKCSLCHRSCSQKDELKHKIEILLET